MKRIFILLMVLSFNICAIYARNVWVSGESAAVTLFYDGVYVTGTYNVKDGATIYNPETNNDVLKGDIIVSVSGKSVDSIEQFYDSINDSIVEEDTVNVINLQVLRNGSIVDEQLKVFSNNGNSPLCGLYLKDRITGIGTITYFDEVGNVYGAFGHALQSSQSINVPTNRGVLYEVPIVSVHKSSKGTVGEKVADTSSLAYVGKAFKNTMYGIYGSYDTRTSDSMKVEIGSMEEVHLGNASILTVVNGTKVEEFAIEIQKLNPNSKDGIKGIQFEIVDSKLLSITGGIVQGMSGSPMLQDGKLVGAVTHAVINNPNKGYGIFIENMLEVAE